MSTDLVLAFVMVFDVVPAFEGTEKEAQAASELQFILFLLGCSVLRFASVILAFIVSYLYWAAQSPRWLPSSRVQKWVCKTTRE